MVGDYLHQKRGVILKKWFHHLVETYPADTARFLQRERDPFANPVGHTLSREMEMLYDELLGEMNLDKTTTCLDNILRIRSVQDFPPSEAVAFLFSLKDVVREGLAQDIKEKPAFDELLEFESRIDKLALLALDRYVACREKVYQIRMKEVKAQQEMAFRLLSRVNLSKAEGDP